MLEDFFFLPGRIEQKNSTWSDSFQNIIASDISWLMEGNEISNIHQIFGFNRMFTKAQVGNGNPA